MQDKGVTFRYSPLFLCYFVLESILNDLLEHFTADTFKIENRAFYAVNYKPFLFFRKIFEHAGFRIERGFLF